MFFKLFDHRQGKIRVNQMATANKSKLSRTLRNPFLIYMKEIKGKFPGLSCSELACKASLFWQVMSPEAKLKYINQAHLNQKRRLIKVIKNNC